MMLGFVGLGDMGLPMARRLLATGNRVIAWNRSPDKLAALCADGAVAAASLAEVMERADLVGLCLTSHQAVDEIAWGPNGLFSAPEARATVVADFSTGAPEAARLFARRAESLGISWVDTPFSGGVAAAGEGKLVIFAGGERPAITALQPLLAPLASRVTHMGPVGAGQLTKLCNNALAACNLLMIAETIALARKAGLDVAHLPAALKGGAADTAHLQIFGQRMAEHCFEPRLGAIALIEKDVGLTMELAEAHGARTPMLELVSRLYAAVRDVPEIEVREDVSRLIGLFEPVPPLE